MVVSSYEIMMADRKHLQRYEWRYLVVDEGHRLKNHDCRLLRELRYLNVQTKLLLTGGREARAGRVGHGSDGGAGGGVRTVRCVYTPLQRVHVAPRKAVQPAAGRAA